MKLAINKKIFISTVIVFLLFAYCLLFIDSVEAQPFGEFKLYKYLDKVAGQTDDKAGGKIGKADLPTIVGKILYGVLGFLGVACLLLIIYAGIRWTMAGGNEETVTSARQTIKYAIIGVIVILGAYAASIYIIEQVLTVTEPAITQDVIGEPRGGVTCETNANCPTGLECINRQCIPPLIGLMGCCVYQENEYATKIGYEMTEDDCDPNNTLPPARKTWTEGPCP